MEVLRRARRPVRREFESLHRELEVLLKEVPLKEEVIEAKFKILGDAYDHMQQHDSKVMEQLAVEKSSEADEDKEYDEIRELKTKYEMLRVRKEKLVPASPAASSGSVTGGSADTRIRNYKLPPMKIKSFTGELTDWLAFWAQFSKIDEDPNLEGSDKFYYLLQSLEPGTDAHEIAKIYQSTNEGYAELVAALKKRYGNEDVLLQVYVRQLLNLVISNANAKEKVPVETLYLKLDSHLRALKTMNLAKADPATWLFPLVESSLPEKVLENWQRSALSSHDGSKEDPPRTRLDLLMAFVEREVEIRQRLDITKSFVKERTTGQRHEWSHGAEKRSEQRGGRYTSSQRRSDGHPSVPTLSSFYNSEEQKCAFCGKTNHQSKDCFRAREMTFDEKIAVLKKMKLCFRCCGPHVGRDCKSEKLDCKVCHRQHHTILCRDYKRKPENVSVGTPPAKKMRVEPEEEKTVSSKSNVECTSEVALQTLLVKIQNGKNEKIVRAFIDSGSQRSYILKKIARELGLEAIGVERVVHSLFGGRQTTSVAHNKYYIKLQSVVDDFRHVVEVREQEKICTGIPKITEKYPCLQSELKDKNVTLVEREATTGEIGLLIGADIYAHILTGEIVRLSCGAVAIQTKLGWTVMGNMPKDAEKNENLSSLCLSMSIVDASVTKLWELDTLGIKDPCEEAAIKKKIELARENYVKNVSRKENGRYCVKLPWKDDIPPLPHNREVAYKRLQSATKKLISSNLFEPYNNVFREWENEGFIEKVTSESDGGRVHYLPHRPVIKDSLTTPVRPVFDASCRVGKSPSLNDCLFTGENYILLIPEILLRFREKRVAFVSDIRKAFQMIEVDLEDRDAQRFLWWTDANLNELIEYRHDRVVFGITCSPFILAAVLYHHLTSLPEDELDIGKKILSTLYVDNCVSSEDTMEEYLNFKARAVELLSIAKMELRMWLSNIEEIEDETTQTISVLGILWDRKRDEMFVNMKNFSVPEKVTKRVILSTIQKVFDPIRFTSPCLLPMKILLQRTWLVKAKWDEELPEDESKKFRKLCESMLSLKDIRIPRLSTGGVGDRRKWSVHIFTDASQDAYSAAIFLRVEEEDDVSVQLLLAKSRLAPTKRMTIPKLELMGCLIGVRLAETVKRALSLEGVRQVFWCDSTTALAWIRRDDQWGTFVANRTKEINELNPMAEWRHVPGVENPADLPSRGCMVSDLARVKWWEGPKWLYGTESEWPQSKEKPDEEEVNAERKKGVVSALAVQKEMVYLNEWSGRKSHSFGIHVRIIGWIRRFLHNKFVKNHEKRKKGPLTATELSKAEFVFVREIQQEAFTAEVREKITGLEITEDEWGILRVKTRLTYRTDLGDFRVPMLLPNKSEIVKQLIMDTHRLCCHAGVGFLTVYLRKKYWIIKARHTIKSVLSKCNRCRRFSAKSIVPEPAPLPLDRVKDAELFEVVGVDLAGPLMLRSGAKAWFVIFTCGVYRAVHFELVKKISTIAFLRALEIFVEKFRRPAVIYSDNGTNFRGADNLFRKIDWSKVSENEKASKIEWKFNPVTSSWWGGWWERLIRTAKDLLRRTVGKGTLSWDELRDILRTVSDVMNERPLTHVSENTADLEPLTPSLFLHPFGNTRFPERELSESGKLRFRLSYMRTLREELKKRFVKEYLSMLVNRYPKRITRELRVGELVLIGYDHLKRIEWPLGRIIELFPGKDQVCRVARVKTEKGDIVRSVQRLYPLEADSGTDMSKALREKGAVTRSGRRVKVPVRFE